jgi:hypothetical protein
MLLDRVDAICVRDNRSGNPATVLLFGLHTAYAQSSVGGLAKSTTETMR